MIKHMNNTTHKERPLILFTNDDGIASPGLWAVVEAFYDIGDVLVVAPREQQSGMGAQYAGRPAKGASTKNSA